MYWSQRVLAYLVEATGVRSTWPSYSVFGVSEGLRVNTCRIINLALKVDLRKAE